MGRISRRTPRIAVDAATTCWLVCGAVSGLTAAPQAGPSSLHDMVHVATEAEHGGAWRFKPRDTHARALMEEGAQRSETIAGLLRRLASTDLVVYVSVSFTQCPIRPTTRLIASTPDMRHVSICLPRVIRDSPSQPARPVAQLEQLTLLGHELCHALEIGGATWVREQGQMTQLYRQIGRWNTETRGYETNVAVTTQRKVERELRERR